MGFFFWPIVWILMASAFTTAWVFIVRGCEALDKGHDDSGSDVHVH